MTCIGFSINDKAVDCMLAVGRHGCNVFQHVFFCREAPYTGVLLSQHPNEDMYWKKIILHSCVEQASTPA